MTAKQFYEQYLGTTVSDYSITTIKMLEDYAAIAIAEHEAGRIRQLIDMKTYGDRFQEDLRNDIIESIITVFEYELPVRYQPQEGGEL